MFRPDPLALPGATPSTVVFTGDLARRDDTGRLYHCDRRDAVVKTLGFRVSPDEISDLILATGEVAECEAHRIPDAARGRAIATYVVLRTGGSLDAVRMAIGRELPRHTHPTRLLRHPALPRTPNGKIDFYALKAMVASD